MLQTFRPLTPLCHANPVMRTCSGRKPMRSAPHDPAGRSIAFDCSPLSSPTPILTDCRAEIVGPGARHAAFHSMPSLI